MNGGALHEFVYEATIRVRCKTEFAETTCSYKRRWTGPPSTLPTVDELMGYPTIGDKVNSAVTEIVHDMLNQTGKMKIELNVTTKEGFDEVCDTLEHLKFV